MPPAPHNEPLCYSDTALTRIRAYMQPDVPDIDAAVALVFGTPHKCDLFAQRIMALWKQKRFKHIILTGGITIYDGHECESRHLKRLLLACGLPEDIIWVEDRSTNIGENAALAHPILSDIQAAGYATDPLLGIGKIHAMRRCLMTLEKYFPHHTKSFATVNTFTGLAPDDWQAHEKFVRYLLAEYKKIPDYLVREFIAELQLNECTK